MQFSPRLMSVSAGTAPSISAAESACAPACEPSGRRASSEFDRSIRNKLSSGLSDSKSVAIAMHSETSSESPVQQMARSVGRSA